MIHLPQFVGQEVHTEEVEDRTEDLIRRPEGEPGSLVKWIDKVVEHVGPGYEDCQVNAEGDKEDFNCVLSGKGPLEVDDGLDTSVREEGGITCLSQTIEEFGTNILCIGVDSYDIKKLNLNFCVSFLLLLENLLLKHMLVRPKLRSC
jgi:hypothetical protein